MPKYRRPPLTAAEVWQDGPPIRMRDLVAITGLHVDTLYQDIQAGELIATKRQASKTSPFLIDRSHARRYLASMGLMSVRLPATTGTSPVLQPAIFRSHPELLQAVADVMGLATTLRNAVAVASRVTGGSGGVQCDVTHEAWTGRDGYGKPTYASGKTRKAIVERTQRMIRTTGGNDVLSRARITFLDIIKANGATGRTEPIDPRDRFTLPDGTTGPVLDVIGVIDPSTERPFAHEVLLG